MVAFTASLLGEGVQARNNSGVWVWEAGASRLLVRRGDPAAGVNLQFFEAATGLPRIVGSSDAGQFLVVGQFTGADPANDRWGAWLGTSAADLKLVMRSGMPMPGGGTLVTAVDDAWFLTSSGELVLFARMLIDGGARDAIWAGPLDALELVMLAGTAAPGAGGRLWQGWDRFHRPVFSASGQMAFLGRYDGVDEAIWTGTPQELRLIAAGNQPLPGDSSVVDSFYGFGDLQINEVGQLALRISIVGDTGDTGYYGRLYRYTPGVGFEVIVTGDDAVDDQGAPQAVTSFTDRCASTESVVGAYTSRCLDEEGRVVFLAQFADQRTALVLSSPLAPDPSGVGKDILVLPALETPVTPTDTPGSVDGEGTGGNSNIGGIAGTYGDGVDADGDTPESDGDGASTGENPNGESTPNLFGSDPLDAAEGEPMMAAKSDGGCSISSRNARSPEEWHLLLALSTLLAPAARRARRTKRGRAA